MNTPNRPAATERLTASILNWNILKEPKPAPGPVITFNLRCLAKATKKPNIQKFNLFIPAKRPDNYLMKTMPLLGNSGSIRVSEDHKTIRYLVILFVLLSLHAWIQRFV